MQRVIAGLFLLLFSAYYTDISFFNHCHIIDGVTIVHSHAAGSEHTSGQSNGHSAESLSLIQLHNNLLCESISIFTPELTPFISILAELNSTPVTHLHGELYFVSSSRAPPAAV